MSKLACMALIFYKKYISPLHYVLLIVFGIECKCRFKPTCSEYAFQCFKKYKFFYALILSIKRLLRCNSFCKYDYNDFDK